MAFKERWQNVRNQQIADQVRMFTDRFLKEAEISADSVVSRFQFALRGFTARMNAGKAEALRHNPQVEFVEQNRRFRAINSPAVVDTTGFSTMSSQTTPWGILRVGGPFDGSYKRAWILDTGIDLDHPDLNVDITNSASFITGEDADDLFGHGTHVAGILAAKSNSRDVVGVAAGASVVSVKVANQFGNSTPNIICDGIEHVMENAPTTDVVNMSIGLHDPDNETTAMDNCVENAADIGYRIVISAGNHAVPADEVTPARWNMAMSGPSPHFDRGMNLYKTLIQVHRTATIQVLSAQIMGTRPSNLRLRVKTSHPCGETEERSPLAAPPWPHLT